LIEMESMANETEFLLFQVNALPFNEYCSSPQPRVRQCVVEYEKLSHNVREVCERAGGYYVEAFYKSECEAETSRLVFVATDEPSCIGTPCDTVEATTWVKNQVEQRIQERFESGGYYTCKMTYTRVVQFESIYRTPEAEKDVPSPTTSQVKPPSPSPQPANMFQPSQPSNIFERPSSPISSSKAPVKFFNPFEGMMPTESPAPRHGKESFGGFVVSFFLFLLLLL
jgi:hypothetical protein